MWRRRLDNDAYVNIWRRRRNNGVVGAVNSGDVNAVAWNGVDGDGEFGDRTNAERNDGAGGHQVRAGGVTNGCNAV